VLKVEIEGVLEKHSSRMLSRHHGWDKAKSLKNAVVATTRRHQPRTTTQRLSSTAMHFSRTAQMPSRPNHTTRRMEPAGYATTTNHNRSKTSTEYTNTTTLKKSGSTNQLIHRRRHRANAADALDEFRIPSSHRESFKEESFPSSNETLEQANFELTSLRQKCQAQQQIIDTLYESIQVLKEEDENRAKEVINSLNSMKSMIRKYDEGVTTKFDGQHEQHARRVKRMEGAMVKNIKNVRDKLYRNHAAYVAQQNINIQETIDRTSGKQRRIMISLTSKGVHWLAMGMMTFIRPCFKLLRCCGVRKTKLSKFAADYLAEDQVTAVTAELDDDERPE